MTNICALIRKNTMDICMSIYKSVRISTSTYIYTYIFISYIIYYVWSFLQAHTDNKKNKVLALTNIFELIRILNV